MSEQPPFDSVNHPDASGVGTPVASSGSYQVPADYYAAPPSAPAGRGCPRWIPITCGLVGCFVLIVLFVGGALVMRAGSGFLSGWFLEQLESDLNGKMTADVTAQQKASLHEAFGQLKSGGAGLMQMPDLLEKYKSAVEDGRVDSAESDRLIEAARAAAKRH